MFRSNPSRLRAALLFLSSSLLAVPAAQACSSCGCSLGTDFAGESYTTTPGLKLDLRYDFVDQNQLRRGRAPVDRAALEFPNDDEIQQGTLSRFYTLSADYGFRGGAWGVNVSLPYLDREHETIAEGDTDVSTSHTRNVGDLRIVGRYQGFFTDRSWGVQLGLKLPTGEDHERFDTGPQQGEIIDRGLQSGSGTTDLIAGVYNTGRIAAGWDRFEQVQLKQALNSSEDFRPSTQVSFNAGVRWLGSRYVVPQLQINARWEGRELGAQGDYENSGDKVLDLSPGVTLRPLPALSVYSFVQLPLYQDYTGYQLAPRYTVSAGLRYAW